MRSPALRTAVLSLAVLALAALGRASLAQDTDPAEQALHDNAAFKYYSASLKTLTDRGNLQPDFSTVTILKLDTSGHGTAGYQALVKNDDRYAFVRTHWFNESSNVVFNEDSNVASEITTPLALEEKASALAAYGFYFDGFAEFFAPGGVESKRSQNFPRALRSRAVLTDRYPATSKPRTLYVSEISDTYPGFEWLKGPFSIIRQQGDDRVYAVWSATLNWPVKTSGWEVKGAVVDGKSLGQANIDDLAKVAAGKGFSAELTKLAARRADFEKALQVRPVAQTGPVDVLPQYKGQAPRDPEAEMASTYIPAAVAGATAVSAVDVRITSPALWTVSRGNRKVYVLGVPYLFGDDVDWNKVRLTNRLRDAQRGRLILPPLLEDEDYDGPVAAPPSSEPIPSSYQDRIRKAAATLGRPAERYLDLSPFMAGFRLTRDFRTKAGLKAELVTIQVAKLAQNMGLKTSPAGTIGGPDYEQTTPASGAGLACLDAALDEVEAGKPAFDRAMAAWATGDVRTALTAPRGLERCSFAFPGEFQTREDGIKDQVEAIEAGLAPGNAGSPLRGNGDSVAVVHLRALLSVDGVLARLQAQGYKIDAPKS